MTKNILRLQKEKIFNILVLDIETAPIIANVWGLWDQNVGLNQIKTDWHVMSVAAKWLGDSKVHYKDQRGLKDMTDDKEVLNFIWKLLDKADIVIAQNGDRFDIKKLNARFILNGMRPPSSYRTIDTLKIAKKYFAFTSNKLEYMTDKLNKKYKKLKHAKFSGFELWKQCLAGNMSAWKEMKKYNCYDVLSLEELYYILAPWDNKINFSIFTGIDTCSCGSHDLVKNGIKTTNTGRYQRYVCKDCGKEFNSKKNLLSRKDLAKIELK